MDLGSTFVTIESLECAFYSTQNECTGSSPFSLYPRLNYIKSVFNEKKCSRNDQIA
jgi:hypothetical protein